MPDVDALVGHLGQQLAHHRDRQRRRREVAELARVLRVHLAAGQPVAELVEHVGDRAGARRARAPARRIGPKNAPRSAAYGDGSPIARFAAPGRTGSRGPPPTYRRRAAPSPRATWPRRRSRSARARDARRSGRSGRSSCGDGMPPRSSRRRDGVRSASYACRRWTTTIPPAAPGSTRALDPLGVDYELFACDPALADTAAFCAAYGFDPGGFGQHDRRHRQDRPAALRRLRDAGAVPARREPDRPRPARDAQGVVRPGRGRRPP